MGHFCIGAFAIIFDEHRRVLFCLREDLSIWNLPGGGAEPDEAPWEAVVREVKEETGLEVRVERLTGVYWRPEHSEVNFAFECSISGGKLIKTWEAAEVEYFSLSEMPDRVAQRHVARVKDSLDNNGTAVMKVQIGSSWWELEEREIF